MKEGLLVHVVGASVVAEEYHLDAFVGPGQEQVQQDKKALGQVLALLIHGARHIHQAEHDRLAGRLRLLDAVNVTQVEGIKERDAPYAPAQMVDFLFQPADFLAAIFRIPLERLQLLFQLLQLGDQRRSECDAPPQRAAQGTNDVDVSGRALARELAKPARTLFQLSTTVRCVLTRCGSSRSSKKYCVNSSRLSSKDEVVFTLAFVARRTAAAATPSAAQARDLVTPDVFLIARVDHFPPATGPVPEHRFGDILARNGNALRVFDLANAALAHGLRHGAANMLPMAAQEALSVGDALVLASQSAIDDLVQGAERILGTRPDCAFTPHWGESGDPQLAGSRMVIYACWPIVPRVGILLRLWQEPFPVRVARCLLGEIGFMELLERIRDQITSVKLPLFAITVTAIPRPDTPMLLMLHWHGFRHEVLIDTPQPGPISYRPVATSALQLNDRWRDVPAIDLAAMEAAWELGAWDVARDERRSCMRPGADASEALECLRAFGSYPEDGGGPDMIISEAPDSDELVKLGANVGYLRWQFRPVRGGIWTGLADDVTLKPDGTREPPCPLLPVPPSTERANRTVYRFGQKQYDQPQLAWTAGYR